MLFLAFSSFNDILIYLYLSNLFPGSWIYKGDATEASSSFFRRLEDACLSCKVLNCCHSTLYIEEGHEDIDPLEWLLFLWCQIVPSFMRKHNAILREDLNFYEKFTSGQFSGQFNLAVTDRIKYRNAIFQQKPVSKISLFL